MKTFPVLALLLASTILPAQSPQDTDHDGLPDALETQLLAQFLPKFMVSQQDCSILPAQFVPTLAAPTVEADDGTIYAQAFPSRTTPGQAELHFYHLWRRDCGELGHALDTEHVATLIALPTPGHPAKALFWYAAAHEDTLCDASQITRASTLSAEDHGAPAWISPGKHASFLSRDLCSHGCGGDRCDHMQPLAVTRVINLGEPTAPMNDIAWLHAPQWPLDEKMRRTDFTEPRLQRLEKLPATDVAWANPSKRPAQAAILGMNAGLGGAATGARSTDTALVIANRNTTNALSKSTHNVLHALKKSAQKTGDFLNPNK